jgi:hypothetical protein
VDRFAPRARLSCDSVRLLDSVVGEYRGDDRVDGVHGSGFLRWVSHGVVRMGWCRWWERVAHRGRRRNRRATLLSRAWRYCRRISAWRSAAMARAMSGCCSNMTQSFRMVDGWRDRPSGGRVVQTGARVGTAQGAQAARWELPAAHTRSVPLATISNIQVVVINGAPPSGLIGHGHDVQDASVIQASFLRHLSGRARGRGPTLSRA